MCTSLSPLPFRECGDAQSDQRTIARLRVLGCAFQATLTKRITRTICQGLLIINGHDETGGHRVSFLQSLGLYRCLLRMLSFPACAILA